MTWIDKLERKFGKYAIRNLSRYLVFGLFIGYILSYGNRLFENVLGFSPVTFLEFDAGKILHLQIWRLVTWLICPPPSGGTILTIIFLLCLIPMGSTLETFLGSFKMNVYIIGGVLLSDIGGLLVYGISLGVVHVGFPVYLSTYYIVFSMFLALALCMPNATVRLYFVLPIRMKWMLVIYILDLAYELWIYFRYGLITGFFYGTEIIFALLNLALFFLFVRNPMSHAQRKRHRQFQSAYNQRAQKQNTRRTRTTKQGSTQQQWQNWQQNPQQNATRGTTRHKCVICGRTEVSDPDMIFRYCSKCKGNLEYCQEHLFTHEHKI